MAIEYDIKWKNDIRMYINTFKSFVLEGNINDLQPVESGDGYKYFPLDIAIAEMFSNDYCVVFYDHTKKSGEINAGDPDRDIDPVPLEEMDEKWFNSFIFYSNYSFNEAGERILSPNIEMFKEYYQPEYASALHRSATTELLGAQPLDMHRIVDAMKDFETKKQDAKYADAKPFMFILPNVSRFMTVPGRPTKEESAILMLLFNATQLEDTPCKLMMFVDKLNDYPTWFESESNNSAIKKLYLPMPDGKFRETFFKLELLNVMDAIAPSELDSKIVKFASYTENYSLRRLRQLKDFITTESANAAEDTPSYTKVENIDKTVMYFDLGQSKNPWKDAKLMERINSMAGAVAGKIKGQNTAILKSVDALQIAATGVKSAKKNDRRPRAVMLFAGPTGVGKTELAKQISERIFQKQDSMIRFDMSEFREDHSDARLFGAPPGYVGYEAGGELTRAVKQNPFTVILFDEIEKASPRIWDKFLQILGDGRLTDGKGETVYFTQSIIIFTSNMGITADISATDESVAKINVAKQEMESTIVACQSEEEKKRLIDQLYKLYFIKARQDGLTYDICRDYLFDKCYKELGQDSSTDAFNKFVSECVKGRIEAYFEGIGRREIMGRIGADNILVFNFVSPEVAVEIAEKTIEDFVDYMRSEHDSALNMTLTEEARSFILAEVQQTKIVNLGGREVVARVEKLIGDAVGKFLSLPEYFDQKGLSIVITKKYGRLLAELV